MESDGEDSSKHSALDRISLINLTKFKPNKVIGKARASAFEFAVRNSKTVIKKSEERLVILESSGKKITKEEAKEIEDLKSTIIAHQDQINRALLAIEKGKERCEALTIENRQKQLELDAANSALVAISQEKELTVARVVDEANIYAANTFSEASSEVAQAESRSVSLQNQIAFLENEKHTILSQLQDLQINFDSIVADRSRILTEINLERVQHSKAILGLQADLGNVRVENNSLNHQLKCALDDKTILENKLTDLNNQGSDLYKNYLEYKAGHEQLVQKLDSKNSELAQLVEDVNNYKKQNDFLTKNIDEKDSELKKLVTQIQSQEFELNDIHKRISGNETMSFPDNFGEMLSLPIRERIPRFSGCLDDLRVEDWFAEAERTAKSVGWSKEQMKRYFAERFTHVAHSVDEVISNNPAHKNASYDDWKNLIIQEFKDPLEDEVFIMELSNIRQKDRERVKDFGSRIEKLFVKAYGNTMFYSQDNDVKKLRDNILKKALQNGLKEGIAGSYWNRVPASSDYRTALKTAIEVESVLSSKNKTSESLLTHGISSLSLEDDKRQTEKIAPNRGNFRQLKSNYSTDREYSGQSKGSSRAAEFPSRSSRSRTKFKGKKLGKQVHFSSSRDRESSRSRERSRTPHRSSSSEFQFRARSKSPFSNDTKKYSNFRRDNNNNRPSTPYYNSRIYNTTKKSSWKPNKFNKNRKPQGSHSKYR